MRTLIAVALLLVGCEHKESAPPVPVRADAAPTAETERAQAALTMAQNCQMCHSLELVQTQRLGRAGWEKEVKKMIGWGAPVPPEAVASLVDWLSAELGTGAPLPPAGEIEVAAVVPQIEPDRQAPAGDTQKGAALYQAACASCHGADGVGGPVGPTLVHRPALYRAREFEDLVRAGRQRMPAVPLEPPAVRDVIAFLRAQR